MALILMLCGFVSAVLAVAACAEALVVDEASGVVLRNGCFIVAGVFFAAAMVFMVRTFVKGARERRRENQRRIEEAEAAGNAWEESKVEADVRLEGKQGRVAAVMVGALVLVYVFLSLVAHFG